MYSFLKVIKSFALLVRICIYVLLLAVGPFVLIIKHAQRKGAFEVEIQSVPIHV
jgi:hypothetical protein